MADITIGSDDLKIIIRGLDEAQRANVRHLNSLKMNGALGEAVRRMETEAIFASRDLTHVWTGTLRASHIGDRPYQESDFVRGVVHIAPNQNPIHGIPANIYGVTEHTRGFTHAFYERVANERGQAILKIGADAYQRGLR